MAVYKIAIILCVLAAVALRFPLLGPIAMLPLLLLATPPDFAIRAGLLLGLVLVPEWILGPGKAGAGIPTLTAYLLCLLVLAWAYAARERLVAPDEDPVGRWFLNQFGGCYRALIAWSAIIIFLLFYFPAPGPYSCMLLLFFMGLVRRRLPETHAAREAWWHSVLDTSLLTACVCICLLVVELGLRMTMLPPVGMRAMLQPHPKYLFMLMPGRVNRQTFSFPGRPPYVLTYETSSQGFVDREYGPKKPGEYRILMLGDSMMMGYGVEMPYSIPRHLERLLAECDDLPCSEVSIINAGCAAAGPLQELGILRERGLPLDPDLVVLQIFPANDVQDATLKPLKAYNPDWLTLRQKILRQTEWRYRNHWWLTRNSYLYERLTVLFDDPNLLPNLLEASWLYPPSLRPKPHPPEDRPFWLEPNLAEWYPELQKAVDQLCDYVLAMRDACRARGIKFVAYPIPCHTEFNVEAWAVHQESLPPGLRYVRYRAETYIQEFLRANDIPTLSVAEALEAYPDPEALVMPDSHLSSIGNRIVARRLMEYLCAHYLNGGTIAHDAAAAPSY